MRSARHRAAPTGWWQGLDELVAVLLPTCCPGCGHHDVSVCEPCRGIVTGPFRPVTEIAGARPPAWPADLDGYATTSYTGPTRALLHAWKDRGRQDLTPVVAAALQPALTALARALAPDPLLVVPVPSPPANLRRRGADLLADACRVAVRVSAARSGTSTHVVAAVLRQRPGLRDQAGLGATARRRNLTRGLILTRPVTGARVVLVDDIITTGASTAVAAATLTDAGAEVLAVVAVAVTPPPGPPRGGSGGSGGRGGRDGQDPGHPG